MKKKQAEKAKANAEACLKSLKGGKSINESAEALGATVKTTGYFKRNDAVPEVGYEPNLTAEVFKLSKKNPLPENIISGQKGFYVIRFKDRKEPDPEAFKKQESELLSKLLQMKKQRAFDQWLAQVRNNSTVAIEEGFLDTT